MCGSITVCLRASLFVIICKPVEKSLNCKWPLRQGGCVLVSVKRDLSIEVRTIEGHNDFFFLHLNVFYLFTSVLYHLLPEVTLLI